MARSPLRPRGVALAAALVAWSIALACGQGPPPPQSSDPQSMIDNAIADGGQLNTMAFDGIAFITGAFGFDTFLPPGKVGDYFAFQFMRDIDAAQMGHNTNFLTRIAGDVLDVLTDEQLGYLSAYATSQYDKSILFAKRRFPLMGAFRDNMMGVLPKGRSKLSQAAVLSYSAKLYALDGALAYRRAQAMAKVINSMTQAQLDKLKAYTFGDYNTWVDKPQVIDAVKDKLKAYQSQDAASSVMDSASSLFSWLFSPSILADVYFCPERHAMYFGGFGFKTLTCHGKDNCSISTGFTADAGVFFQKVLTADQNAALKSALEAQRSSLADILTVRQAISTELRKMLTPGGKAARYGKVISLSKQYGRLDGQIAYLYATAFQKIYSTLTPDQLKALTDSRVTPAGEPTGPFLYANEASGLTPGNTRFLFSN